MNKGFCKIPAIAVAFALTALAGCSTSVEPETFTVTFDRNFADGQGTGTAPGLVSAVAGASILIPGPLGLARPGGYVFGGWNTRADGQGTTHAAGSGFTVTADVTLYAVWVTPYIVSFDRNFADGQGTGTAPAAMPAPASASITLPERGDLERSGYVFGGWNTQADGQGTPHAANSGFTVTANATLFAAWVPAGTRFTVTFNANLAGQGTGTAPGAQTKHVGTVIQLPGRGDLEKPGLNFGGWNTRADGQGTAFAAEADFTILADVTLYAAWVTPRFTVTFNRNFADGYGTGVAPAAQTVYVGTTITLPGRNTLVRPGYRFDGWNAQADGQGTPHAAGSGFTVTADVTLYAAWAEQEYISISITGLPDISSVVHIEIRNPGGVLVASAMGIQMSGVVEFNMGVDPGDYRIALSFMRSGEWSFSWYHSIGPEQILSGRNEIPFSRFRENDPITVEVTGMPAWADNAIIELFEIGGTGRASAIGFAWQIEATANFEMYDSDMSSSFAMPGTYEVRLTFLERLYDREGIISMHRIASVSIAEGTNTIAFGSFQIIPVLTISVTNVPWNLFGFNVEILLAQSGGFFNPIGEAPLQGTTAMAAHGVVPGTYNVALVITDAATGETWSIREATAIPVTAAGATIPFGDFTETPVSRITITGVPPIYDGTWVTVSVTDPVTWDAAGLIYGIQIVGDSITVTLFDWDTRWVFGRSISGLVALDFEWMVDDDNWDQSSYVTSGIIDVPHGQTTVIPWSEFAARTSFSATTERSGPGAGRTR